jgi:hypothetical protein
MRQDKLAPVSLKLTENGRLSHRICIPDVAAPMYAVGCSRRWPGAREETMDPDPGAPEVDPEELSRYIADRTGIPVEVVARVLEAEMEYLIERGIAQPER